MTIRPNTTAPVAAVAFTGHRQLADAEAVRASLARAFAHWFEGDPADAPTLITGFAEGADRLAVEAWTALGGQVHYVFPYPDPHSPTHAWTDDPSAADPSCRIDLSHLPGAPERTRITILGPTDVQSGHEVLARWLAGHACHLVAVWDGMLRASPTDRLGGTAHVVELAKAKGLGVTVVGV